MKKKSLVSLVALALLAACECDSEEVQTVDESMQVTEDTSLSAMSADFIANAGDRAYFAFDKSALSQESIATLSRQAEWLKSHPKMNVLIEGHCDERGTREYNLGLGERRADAAAKFLAEEGVSGDRIRTISYGKDRPIVATGSPQEIHKLNRVAVSVLEQRN